MQEAGRYRTNGFCDNRAFSGYKSEFRRQGRYPVRKDSMSTKRRKVHRRRLAFCVPKGDGTKPTARLHPKDFLAQLVEYSHDKRKAAGSNPVEIKKKQKSVGTWNENTLIP